MELNRENFDNFIDRLRYYNKSKGVDEHCTSNPIFIVQSLEMIDGINLGYDPEYYWTSSDGEEKWAYVNAHFTKEAAEAFIKRKSHDYRKLRIYVDSQYLCPEFNAIVSGLISGEIRFTEAAK